MSSHLSQRRSRPFARIFPCVIYRQFLSAFHIGELIRVKGLFAPPANSLPNVYTLDSLVHVHFFFFEKDGFPLCDVRIRNILMPFSLASV